ncbi:MAG: translation initiation factor IF-2 [Patescibacteria group bacterium]|jgi:translation initiation factor IF-2
MTQVTQRAPVIAVLGHVDHGKTTLLDTIRTAHVAAKEFGGITQHIGAYEVLTPEGKKITFIDTPGHEAFTKIRTRGVEAADIALLVVAADSSVQPQTKEAIKIILDAKIPYIVVINKVDLPDIIMEKVFKDLTKNNVILEGRGGDVPYVQLSAKTGKGVPQLLELITLVAEMRDFTYDKAKAALGVVIESKKDRRGIIASLILKEGALGVGDTIYVGSELVKVRALIDDRGTSNQTIIPSQPVELLGCKELPEPGAVVSSMPPEKQDLKPLSKATSDFQQDFYQSETKKFNFMLKVDTMSTAEVVREKLSAFDEISIIKSDIGDLTEADIELAKATKSNFLLFNVKMRKEVERQAEVEGVAIFSYTIIYELLDQVEDLIMALREKQEKEARKMGEARIQAQFVKGPIKIAGLKMMTGKIKVGMLAEVYRGKNKLGETTIKSLYQRSVAVTEVTKGDDCGAIFDPQLDFRQGDIVKLYVQ